MRKKRRPIRLLFTGIVSLGSLIYLTLTFSPSMDLELLSFQLPILYPFFLLLFIAICSFVAYGTKSMIHGVLAGSLVSTYLLFRLNNLTHTFFLVLLLALFLTLELLFVYKK